jgi:hypothetical protein
LGRQLDWLATGGRNGATYVLMPLRRLPCLVLVCLAALAAWAGTPGTFRGTVHEGANTKPGWIYVEAFNGNLRLVDVRRANVHYEEAVEGDDDAAPQPLPSRRTPRLTTGTDVRVTAEQDKRGYWHASEVEVYAKPAKSNAT